MGVQDIQVRILLAVNGMPSVQKLTGALQGQYTAANKVRGALTKDGGVNWTSINSFEKLSGALKEVETDYDAVYRASYRMIQSGQMIQQVGKAGLGLLKESLGAWSEYQFSLMRAANALNVTDSQMSNFSDQITETARATRFYTPAEIAHDTYLWGSATGETVNSLEDMKKVMAEMTPVLKLTAMTQTDFEANMKGVYAILKQFNLRMSDAAQVTADLYQITRSTALEIPDIVNSFKMVGPVAGSMGVTYRDVAIVLGKLGDAGIRGTMAGRALRQMFIQLVKPTAKATEALDLMVHKQLGLNTTWEKLIFPKGQYVGMTKEINLLAEATAKMTQHDRAALIARMSTANEFPMMTALIERQILVQKGLISAQDDAKYSLDGSTKAFDDGWNRVANTWQGIVGLLKNSLMPLMLQAGKSIADALTPVANAISDVALRFSIWLAQNPQIMDLATKFIAVGASLATVTGSALVMIGSMTMVGVSFKILSLNIMRIIGTLLLLELIILTVGYVFYKNVGGITDSIVHLGKVIIPIFTEAIKNIKDFIESFMGLNRAASKAPSTPFQVLAKAINAIADGISALDKNPAGHAALVAIVESLIIYAGLSTGIWATNAAITAMITLSKGMAVANVAFRGFGDAIFYMGMMMKTNPIIAIIMAIIVVVTLLYEAWTNNWGDIQGKTKAVLAWLQQNVLPVAEQIFKGIQGFIDFTVKTVIPSIIGAWNNFVEAVKQVWAFVEPFVLKTIGLMQRLAKPFVDMYNTWGPRFFDSMRNIFAMVSGVVQSLAKTWDEVFNGKIMPTIKDVIQAVADKFSEVMTRIQPLIDATRELAGVIGDVLRTAVADFVDFWNNIFLPIWDAAAKTVLAVLGFIGTLLKEQFNFFMTDIVEPFGKMFIQVFGVTFETIGGVVKGAMTIIQGVIDLVLDAITQITKMWADVLKGDWGALWNDIVGLVTGIIGNIKTIIGGMFETIGSIISGAAQTLAVMAAATFGELTKALANVVIAIWNGGSGIAGDVVNAVWDGLVSLRDWLFNQITTWTGAAFKAITDLPGTMFELGKSIVNSIWNGIVSLKDWFIGKITDFFGSIIPGPLKTVLGMHSPSKVMMGLGKNIIQGLAQGITGTNDAYTAMTAYSKRLAGVGFDINSIASSAGIGNVSLSTDNTRTLKVEIDVTSSDGSVSRLDVSQIAGLLNGGALVTSLEHMAAVQ